MTEHEPRYDSSVITPHLEEISLTRSTKPPLFGSFEKQFSEEELKRLEVARAGVMAGYYARQALDFQPSPDGFLTLQEITHGEITKKSEEMFEAAREQLAFRKGKEKVVFKR